MRSREHEAKPSVSVNPTTSCKKLYEKIREIRQHPSKKIRVRIIQKQSHRSYLLVALFFYGLEWIYLHGSFGSDADGFHGFLIFLMMAIISSEGDHTDARLRLRLTDLYGLHGFSDCPLRMIAPSTV